MNPETMDLLICEEEDKQWLSSIKEEGKWRKEVGIKRRMKRKDNKFFKRSNRSSRDKRYLYE